MYGLRVVLVCEHNQQVELLLGYLKTDQFQDLSQVSVFDKTLSFAENRENLLKV